MTRDRFDARFTVDAPVDSVWERLTTFAGTPFEGDPGDPGDLRADQLWLPGFDASATVLASDASSRLVARKDHDPCAGTRIEFGLGADGARTVVDVSQSEFGEWLDAVYEIIGVGWRHIVADIEAYLAFGVHPSRHLRPWGEFGADMSVAPGGVRVGAVRSDGLAAELGLLQGDVLVVLGGAPISSIDDLITVLRVLIRAEHSIDAEWIRDGELMTGAAPAHAD
jgi:S1-C subfamily serine protease